MTTEPEPRAEPTEERRGFMRSVLMWAGLGLGYSIGLYTFVRYLVPMGNKVKTREMFVGPADGLAIGQSRILRTPSGESYVMARRGAEDFLVLSNICPHLGCRVHWKPQKQIFHCPCHDGVFDAEGRAVSGPPKEADQSLAQLRAWVKNGNVYVEIRES